VLCVSPREKNDNTEAIKKDDQQIMTKENKYNWGVTK
jgi:hypothetical protein